MSKHGIIGRVTQLARANVDAIIDAAQDPQQMLDQLLRDYAANIAEAEQAITQLGRNLRIAQDDQLEDAKAAAQWSKEAEAASQKADELRATGAAIEADRFDSLAKVALERQMIAENDVETIEHTIGAQNESVERLTNGLEEMAIRLSEITRKRNSQPARSHGPQPRAWIKDAVRNIDIMDPSSEVALFEEKVRREQARVGGSGELRSSLDTQFASPDDLDDTAEIEERLKALKTGRAMASARAKAQDQDQAFR
jgi:phage shock protein A